MAQTALTLVFLLLVGIPGARAQPRFYVAATTAADTGQRGNIPGGAVPSVGGMIGIQISDAWSIELEVERGTGRPPPEPASRSSSPFRRP